MAVFVLSITGFEELIHSVPKKAEILFRGPFCKEDGHSDGHQPTLYFMKANKVVLIKFVAEVACNSISVSLSIEENCLAMCAPQHTAKIKEVTR